MSVNEVLKGVGSWSITLHSDTPLDVMDKLQYFGHIVINTGPILNPSVAGDSLLKPARYVGIFRGKDNSFENVQLSGPGMAAWLGDEDSKGDVIEGAITFNNTPFNTAITNLLPPSGAVIAGTIFPLADTYTDSLSYRSRREAIDYLCDTIASPADWRVNGDGTLDAGLESDLFVVNPVAALVRSRQGVDMRLRALGGAMGTNQDVDDFTTRVVLVAESDGDTLVTASADIAPGLNPFVDIHGNAVKFTRVISESTTDTTNAVARAQLQLNRFTGSRNAISLSSEDYDVKGTVAVGDYLWVYDPDLNIEDLNNEVNFRGMRMYPMKLRLTECSWPVVKGMSVAFRAGSGEWLDLTKYVVFESGTSTFVVGGYDRSLVGGSDGGLIGTRPQPNTTIPDAPTWTTPFIQTVYQSPINGVTRAQSLLKWTRPNNTDGSTIVDGDHYEIRWRSGTTPIFPSTHAQMAARTHAQLAAGTHAQPIAYTASNWTSVFVPFTELQAMITELTPNLPYEAQIRVADSGSPPNVGAWSALTTWQTVGDTIAPSTPAAPTVAASRIAVQIVHNLGRSTGGNFNLEPDLAHLNIHASYEPTFACTDANQIGKLLATNAQIMGQVPVVGTFSVESTTALWIKVVAVDVAGNKSLASAGATVTALLIDDAHISSLTVSKVTAGTINASWLIAGEITTSNGSQSRLRLNNYGLVLWNDSNVVTGEWVANDGSIKMVGQLASALPGSGARIIVNEQAGLSYVPEVRFYPDSGSNYSYLNSPLANSIATIGLNSGNESGHQTTLWLFGSDAKMAYTQIGTGSTIGGQVRVGGNFAFLENLTAGSARNGGFCWALDTGVIVGSNVASSGVEGFMSISNTAVFDWKGKMATDAAQSGQAALWASKQTYNGGAVGFGYGATMSGNMAPLCTFADFTGYSNTVICNVYQPTGTGFSAGTGVNGRNGQYSAWAFRS